MSQDLSLQALEALIKQQWAAGADMAKVILEKEDMNKFAVFLGSSDEAAVAVVAELLGTLARNEVNRNTLLSHTEAMKLSIDAVKRFSSIPPRQFAARLVANLCFNSDDGRKQLLDADGVASVCHLLSLDSPTMMQRVVCGAIANMCSTNETVCDAVVKSGALPVLVSFLGAEVSEDVTAMVLRAIGNVSMTENTISLLKSLGVMKKLVDLLSDENADFNIASEAVAALASQLELRSNMMEFVEDFKGINLLLGITEIYEEDEEEEEEQQDGSSQSPSDQEDPLQKAAFEILLDIAKNDDSRPKFDELEVTSRLVKICDAQRHRRSTRRRFACRCLAELSTLDNMTDDLWKFYKSFAALVVDRQESLEVRINASVALGNVACDDQRCAELMQNGIAANLLKVLDEKETNKSARLLTNVCSAIKNISVKQENKKALIEIGAMKAAAHLVRAGHEDIVIYGGITLMKSLMLSGAAAVAMVVKEFELVQTLIDLSNADKKKRESHVLFEAARSVCSIAVHGDEEIRRAVARANNLQVPIALLLTSQFGILHNEACRSLAALLAVDPSCAVSIIDKSEGIATSLVSILQREEEPKPDDFVTTNASEVPVLPFALEATLALASIPESAALLKKTEGMKSSLSSIVDRAKSTKWTEIAANILKML